ncbi:vitelline membrane outer layer protein 1 homolog [Spea bombifrons]|uniref:vitelline membrane outer layer protein 1 homolog n=1 Tax=Spea bombifrons TaxID=233779 RepID=UPI00234AD657|nr:vitelline membrane outer layer protein 1 homolog [Spea bombifrons]
MAHAASLLVLISLVSLGVGQLRTYVISVNNGGSWGEWGRIEWCPDGYVAKGFSMKVEKEQGDGDDTAVNGIRLHCVPRSGINLEVRITSSEGQWGRWTSTYWCDNSYLVSFSLKVEEKLGSGDDTAVTNIMFRCMENLIIQGDGLPWGFHGSWSQSCEKGICGILTKVEEPQGSGDDTALNDIQFFCCPSENK